MALGNDDPRFNMLRAGAEMADNDTLIAMVSVSVAELSVRYGSEIVENILTEMLVSDTYHELTAKAREEREEIIDVAEMKSHDIVSEARAILDES